MGGLRAMVMPWFTLSAVRNEAARWSMSPASPEWGLDDAINQSINQSINQPTKNQSAHRRNGVSYTLALLSIDGKTLLHTNLKLKTVMPREAR